MAKTRGVFEHPKGSGVWWINYYAAGRRHREKVGRKRDAIDLYQKRKADARAGAKLPKLRARTVTFGELMDDAIAYSREHHKSSADVEGKADAMRAGLGSMPADEITPAILLKWLDSRRKGAGKLSPATRNRYRAFVSLCFREGMRNGKVKDNPARNMAMWKESKGRQRYLSTEEYERLMDVMREKPRFRREVQVSIFSGMRLSEQFTLEVRQVDFKRNEIHLTKTKNGSDRTIVMTSVVRDIMREIIPVKAKPTDRVFGRTPKHAVQPRWFAGFLRSAGIDNYTWHNNRHTFCSWLAIAGVPIKTIQELAGHKTIAITSRYAHLCPDHTLREVEKMVAVKVAVPSVSPVVDMRHPANDEGRETRAATA